MESFTKQQSDEEDVIYVSNLFNKWDEWSDMKKSDLESEGLLTKGQHLSTAKVSCEPMLYNENMLLPMCKYEIMKVCLGEDTLTGGKRSVSLPPPPRDSLL
jgi:hypothetical protein